MKLRVIGWTYYDDDLEQGEVGWAARHAIVDEIKKQGYLFSGWSHEECCCCVPVLNDGKMYCCSQRGWGDIMAEAHGYTGRMDYVRFAFAQSIDFDDEIRPEDRFNEYAFVPEHDLNERFELEVPQEVFESAQRAGEIKLDDLHELRYLDTGDTLALICGKQTAEYTVADVDRKRDITEKRLRELRLEFIDFNDREKMRRADEEFNNAKIIMIIKFVLNK